MARSTSCVLVLVLLCACGGGGGGGDGGVRVTLPSIAALDGIVEQDGSVHAQDA